MYSLAVQNSNGEILELSGNRDFDVWTTGLNSLSATVNRSTSANGDGARKNSARLNERNPVFYIKPKPPVAINRNRLYRFFNPKSEVRILYKNDVLDVYIDGTVDTFEGEIFTNKEVMQISIICHDPYFRSRTNPVYRFQHIISLFEFPFSIEAEGIPFSELVRESELTVEHGDVSSGMIIEFTALSSQILNPVFYNLTTQEHIKILFDMEHGDIIRINTNRNRKSITLIRDGMETNILNCMERGSKWLQFVAGENVISYSADEGVENLNVEVTTENKYMGV